MDYTILFNLKDGTFGYGSVYEIEDSVNPYRSNAYQDRLLEEEMIDETKRELFYEESKMYVGEHKTLEEAITEIIRFWYMPEGAIIISSLSSEEEAIQLFKKNEELDYLIF